MNRAHVWFGLSGVVLALVLSGCNALGTSDTDGVTPANVFEDGNQDPGAVSPFGKTRGEPNDSFESAIVAVFDTGDVARLQGTVEADADVDVFDLGAMAPGDTLAISADAADSTLDVSIALFDDQGRLFTMNDDADLSAGQLDARIEETIRHAGNPYYLAIEGSSFATSFNERTGTYRATVTITRGGTVPEPRQQTLLLDFDGGTVDTTTIPVSEVEPFRAGDIARIYRGETERMKKAIVDTVRENYEPFDVTIVTTDDETLPTGDYSTVLFGGSNSVAFGIAESIDLYNADATDTAVIFIESFQPRLFSETPTVDEMGLAIGNIAAHEAGHLLGLHHVDDDTALMDESGPADTFVQDQDFKNAPLSSSIAALGTQDALLLLAEILGLIS